jgi:hypothetical protein
MPADDCGAVLTELTPVCTLEPELVAGTLLAEVADATGVDC